MPRSYIVVEGPHDVEFIARLLRPFGFHRVRLFSQLEAFWHGLVPRDFPYNDDLLKRVPVPVFFRNETHSIAIHSAIGYTRQADTVQETLVSLPAGQHLDSIGIILDADSAESVDQRFAALTQAMREKTPELMLPERPGLVTQSTPAVGVYILPNNARPGTLEDLLLAAAAESYPGLLSAADQYVGDIHLEGLTQDDLEEFNQPAGSQKARVGSIASILKPGKAIQVSIQDNRWLEGSALNLPEVLAITDFLRQLLQL